MNQTSDCSMLKEQEEPQQNLSLQRSLIMQFNFLIIFKALHAARLFSS